MRAKLQLFRSLALSVYGQNATQCSSSLIKGRINFFFHNKTAALGLSWNNCRSWESGLFSSSCVRLCTHTGLHGRRHGKGKLLGLSLYRRRADGLLLLLRLLLIFFSEHFPQCFSVRRRPSQLRMLGPSVVQLTVLFCFFERQTVNTPTAGRLERLEESGPDFSSGHRNYLDKNEKRKLRKSQDWNFFFSTGQNKYERSF